MKIFDFLKSQNIPFYKLWYYISDKTGKKTPIGEKNNIDIKDIHKQENKCRERPKSIFIKSIDNKRKYDEILLSNSELESLQQAYTIFIKYTDNVYCIDIDDKDIYNMDDFINKTKCTIFKDCCWIKGNTKGIHIYVKINNMINYSDQQSVYNDFEGDLIRKNNMWEKIDKEIHNGDNGLTEFEYDNIKHIFNDKINFKQKEVINKHNDTNVINKCNDTNELNESNKNKNELEVYVELGIKYKLFQKMKGHSIWINIGFLIKNELGEKGIDLFINLSKDDPKFVEADVKALYEQLNKTVKSDSKKPITIASLIKYFKDTDKDLTKNLIKEAKNILNKNVKKMTAYDDKDNDFSFEHDKLAHFDSVYFNSFRKSYKIQKKYMEHFISKVLRPEPQYIYIEGKQDIGNKSCIFSERNINTAFRHCKTDVKIADDEYEEFSFTSLWLNDPNIKCFNVLDFIPYNGLNKNQENINIYNLFSGYNPKIFTPYNLDKKDIILKPFKELGLELCGGDTNYFNYFFKFLAHMIQNPNERIPICFIFKGKQGTGKNVFLNAVGNIIGKEHYITSANPKDFFGDYAEGFYHKILVNMNECEGKDTFDFEGKIKSFITEDTITINPKNVRPSQISNVARVIIFTNKPNPIPIDVKSSDRRYCVFQTSDKFLDKKYGTTFWTNLIAHFNKPEFIACLYDELNNLDIKCDWRAERPITEAYKQMCKLYVPVEALFFEHYLNDFNDNLTDNDNENERINSKWNNEINPLNKDVYDTYTKFCKINGFSNDKTFQPSISKFNNRMNELEIPHNIVKSYGYNEVRFTPKIVYDFLLKKKWINRDFNDEEVIGIEETTGEDFVFEI